MTREEILNKAIYIQFPTNYTNYTNYNIPGKEINKLHLPEPGMMYDGYSRNGNHFTTKYHRLFVIPLLSNILNFNYIESEFTIDTRKYKNFDLSIYKPVKEFKFEIFGYTENEHNDDVDWNFLSNSKLKSIPLTEYHMLYAYPHQCSRIINKTIDSKRKLFISGDSQMIPTIAFLACLFKEVWYFDNRNRLQLTDKYSETIFTDVLIELNSLPLDSYMNHF